MTGAAIGIGAGLAAAGTAIAGGAMSVKNTKPRKQFFGNTAEQEQAYRNQYETGIQQGNAMLGQGAGMIGQAGQMAQDNALLSQGMYGQGRMLGDAGIAGQNRGISNMLSAAYQQGPSAAQAQMQAGLDQSQRAMMAQAAAARGGNQAAAMRNAQAQGSQMALDANQQAAVLRAQEQQAEIARRVNAQQAAAQLYGQQSQLGYNIQGQGLGYANQAAGMYGDLGQGIGQMGLANQGQFLDARTAMESAALNADVQVAMAKAQAQQNKRNGLLGFAGALVGGGGAVMGSAFGGK